MRAVDNLGRLIFALTDKFSWVKVSKAKSAFGTMTVSLQVTQIHKGTSESMVHTCTEDELARLSDEKVIVDYMWAEMGTLLMKKITGKR